MSPVIVKFPNSVKKNQKSTEISFVSSLFTVRIMCVSDVPGNGFRIEFLIEVRNLEQILEIFGKKLSIQFRSNQLNQVQGIKVFAMQRD